jgi:SAM-dependent methyltransferase
MERLWHAGRWFGARVSGRCFLEDYERVYPDGKVYGPGWERQANPQELNNFLNHRKFYRFTAQFAPGKDVLDAGCGSGYGAALLAEAGARLVLGVDLSEHALAFAKNNFCHVAEFRHASVAQLDGIADDSFDLTVCSEVLEHVREFGQERQALANLHRVTRDGGIVVLGTPNAELHPSHGFDHAELKQLVNEVWPEAGLFENALLPFGWRRRLWEDRERRGAVGIRVGMAIQLAETALPGDEPDITLKTGLPPGRMMVGDVPVDTTLLHNTHSWVVVARNRR